MFWVHLLSWFHFGSTLDSFCFREPNDGQQVQREATPRQRGATLGSMGTMEAELRWATDEPPEQQEAMPGEKNTGGSACETGAIFFQVTDVKQEAMPGQRGQ